MQFHTLFIIVTTHFTRYCMSHVYPLFSVFTYRYFLHRWPQLCILAVPTDDNGDADCDENTTEEGKVKKHRRRPIGCVVCKIDIENDDNGEPSDNVNITTNNDEDDGNNNSNGNDDNNENNEEDEEQSNDTQNKYRITKLPDNEEYTGYIGMLAVEQTHRRSGIGTALVQRVIHRMQLMGCQSIRLETEVTNKAAVKLYEDRLGFIREELLKKYYLNWGDAYRLRVWLDG